MAQGFDVSDHHGRSAAGVRGDGLTMNDPAGDASTPPPRPGLRDTGEETGTVTARDTGTAAGTVTARDTGTAAGTVTAGGTGTAVGIVTATGAGDLARTGPRTGPRTGLPEPPAARGRARDRDREPPAAGGPAPDRVPELPAARGPITALLFERLVRPPHRFGLFSLPLMSFPARFAGPALVDEDVQLALFVCYELHYQGFRGVDERWEWNPSLLEVREILEARFEEGLARAVSCPPAPRPGETRRGLAELVAAADGPDLSAYLQREADLAQFREFVAHRSIYHLKEADPHTWGIPRLRGRSKAALVEIQTDEYGGGRPERMHSELFRTTMRGLGMDDSYGAYLDRVPAVTLSISNAMSLFGLHRRHLGALLGHLAAFEMTSSIPNGCYSRGLRRLGGDEETCRFYDEHVQADAVHEQIAAHDMCGGFVAQHPSRAGDVLYGAACGLALDRLFAEHLMSSWRRGVSSLRGAGAMVGP